MLLDNEILSNMQSVHSCDDIQYKSGFVGMPDTFIYSNSFPAIAFHL